MPFVEVAVHRPARGVIDVVIARRDAPMVVAVEVHSQILRLEQLIRWTGLKRESLPSAEVWPHLAAEVAPTSSSLLVLRSTAATRAVVLDHATTIKSAYPAPTEAVDSALFNGTPWPGAGLVWADVTTAGTRLLDKPPRGVDVGRVRSGDGR